MLLLACHVPHQVVAVYPFSVSARGSAPPVSIRWSMSRWLPYAAQQVIISGHHQPSTLKFFNSSFSSLKSFSFPSSEGIIADTIAILKYLKHFGITYYKHLTSGSSNPYLTKSWREKIHLLNVDLISYYCYFIIETVALASGGDVLK